MRPLSLLRSVAAAALFCGSTAGLAQEEGLEEPVEQTDETDLASEDETFVFKTEEEEEIENFEREMTEAFAIFGEIFQADPLTEEQEALLPLATQISDKIMPAGALAKATEQSMEPLMQLIMAEEVRDSRTRLAEVTGVDADELSALEDNAADDALGVFDPNFAERTEKTTEIIVSMIARLLEAVEPAYREALSRALTLRFDEAEMNELLTFFATPIGEKFARESFLVHHDPQMLAVMEQMGPAMVEIFPSLIEEFEAIEADIENVRKFSELSEVERAEVARLLEKSVSELDALEPQVDVEVLGEDESEGVV